MQVIDATERYFEKSQNEIETYRDVLTKNMQEE